MVREIKADDRGCIFFTTQGGIFFYNGYKIKPFLTYTKYDIPKLIGGQPVGFLQDNEKHYWFATDFEGLYEYDPFRGKVIPYLEPYKDLISCVYKSNTGRIWIGTNNGLAYIAKEKGKNNVVFIDKKSVTAFSNRQAGEEGFFVATKKHQLEYYKDFSKTIINTNTITGEIKCLAFAAKKLVVGTTNGLYIANEIDYKKGEKAVFTKVNTQNFSIEKYGINCLLYEDSGKLWMGTYGGGLIAYNISENKFYTYRHDKNNSSTIGSDYIVSLYKDATGQIWVGSSQGIDMFNANINLFESVAGSAAWRNKAVGNNLDLLKKLPDSLRKSEHTKKVMLRFIDKSGGIWWSKSDDCSLYYYNINTHIYKPFKKPLYDGNTSSGCLNAMMQDRKGRIWLAAYNGTYLYDEAKGSFENINTYFPDFVADNSNAGNALAEDAEGNIWSGRYEGGLDVFNIDKKGYQHFSLNEGLPDRTINSILIDAYNNLWLSTPNGLTFSKIPKLLFTKNAETASAFFKIYTTEDGLPTNNLGAFLQTPEDDFKNNLFVNSDEGIIKICNTCVKNNEIKPVISFTELRVLNKLIVPDTLPHSILKKPIEFIENIILNYDENSFSLDFTANNPQQATRNTYQYKLDNYEDAWQNLKNSNTVTFTKVPPGEYILHIKAQNNDGYNCQAEKTIVISIKPAFWQTNWFKGLIISVLIGLGYLFYNNRLKNARLQAELKQREAEAKEREAEYKKQLTLTEMSALRAQMNPHFIFNCLNSIHNFTLDNDSDNASKYLTKFARLIRLVLENSRSERVKLANEIAALTLYVEMETLRFKEKVRYEVNVDEDLDTEMLQIPPMLIQPYIENSIWHGLMPKKEGGIVLVNLVAIGEEFLRIEIIDNGIGRARAMQLKSKNATERKSYGMQITSDRVQIIKQLYNIDTKIQIIDLYDDKNEPKGTKVIIEIPV